MASRSGALPASEPLEAIDQAGRWFWNFLKVELSPYPGRAWVVGRMTIAATIVMLIVMTFRLPYGFLGGIYTLFLSRENPTATLRAGVRIVIVFAIATAYSVVGVMTMVADPLTHFLWIVITLFIAFYLIRIIPDYGTAVGFGFMTAGVIPLWDETTLNVNTRLENTLWLAFSVLVGAAVTIAVEYVFRRIHPTTDLTEGIETRLQAVEEVLRDLGANPPRDMQAGKTISFYASAGTSRLRRLMHRSGYSSQFIAQINAGVALLGRLVDLAASLQLYSMGDGVVVDPADRERCLRLADEILGLRRDLEERKAPRAIDLPLQGEPSNLPFLPTMERTAVLIPKAVVGSEPLEGFIPAPVDEQTRESMIVPDAFSNPAHLHFALRGMLAAATCYVVYTAADWPGLSTSIATSIITALSTIGSSRQKQVLRLGGALIGGFVFGMGAQVFVLPYLDSIAGFTVVFAVVTAISAWIATASPRLSYLGVQLALAFYLINLQEFTIQTSLAIARDRVFGVLLGLMSMWLLFDRLGVRNAVDEMQAVFSRNLERLAQLAEQLANPDRDQSLRSIRRLRDQINAGFSEVNAQADAVLFEFGPSRRRKMKIRDDIKRWQPSLRTLLLVEITSWQYQLQAPLNELPEPVAQAFIAFEKDTASILRVIADEVNGQVAEPAPKIQESATKLQQEIGKYYTERGLPLPPRSSDVIRLTQTIASILAPLFADVHSTFVNSQQVIGGQPQTRMGET